MTKFEPQYIDVDLKKNTQYNVPVVTENDTAAFFVVRVFDDGKPATAEQLRAYTSIMMSSERPDRKTFHILGKLIGDNKILFHLGTSEISLTGNVRASVQFYDDDGRLSTAHFRYDVNSDLAKDTKPSETERTLIETVLIDGPKEIARAKKAADDANKARTDLTGAVGNALESLGTDKATALSEMSEATDNANAAAKNADDERKRIIIDSDNKITEVEAVRAATEQERVDTAEERQSTAQERQDTEAERLATQRVREKFEEIVEKGPVHSVNGKTGAVQGMAEQSAVVETNRRIDETRTTLDGRIDNLLGEPPEEGELADLRFSPVTGITHDTPQGRVTDTEERLLQLKERTTRAMHYDETLGEYVNLETFWNLLRTGKKYTVEFNQFSVSPAPVGTKKDANAGLIVEPSTNTFRGRNDYENIGLFMAIDVNAYVDENDDYHVTAMKGDGRFAADGSNGDVYVMAMTGYIKRFADDQKWGFTYSDVPHPGFEILDEAVKPDGSVRPYLLHAKYIAGRGQDGHLASISGVPAEFVGMSHNGQIDKFKEKGVQYSGKTTHDDFYASMMFYLKYATTHSQSVMQGTQYYYVQYTPAIVEQNVSRFILTNAQADNILLHSTVSIGDYGSGSITADRQSAQNYNIANRVKVLRKEQLSDGLNTAVYVDAPPFSTTATSTITTYPWNAGGCDNVLGTDGSPWDNQSGKEPYIINGIEIMVGGYEILQNVIINNNNSDPDNYRVEVFANYDCHAYATSPTDGYDLVGHTLAQTNSSWSYVTKIAIDDQHPSLFVPVEAGGSSTTGFADGIYTNAPTNGYRTWLSFGDLSNGAIVGLRYLYAGNGLAISYWFFLGRLSATGRSRRRAVG